jgi:hypothetical protein
VEAEAGTMVSTLSGILNEGLWLMLRQDAGVGYFIVMTRVHVVVMAYHVSMCHLTSKKQVGTGKERNGFHFKMCE